MRNSAVCNLLWLEAYCLGLGFRPLPIAATNLLRVSFRLLVRFVFVFFCVGAAPVALAEPVYTMWPGNMPESRSEYEVSVVRKALELSEDKYGSFRFQCYERSVSLAITEREIRKGESIQIKTFEQAPATIPRLKDFYWLTNPIISGALGYRQLITTRERLPLFKNIQTLAQLKALRVGQVSSWADTATYKANGFNFVGSVNFETLFRMLNYGRFDYLPLGTIEVQEMLALKRKEFPDLVIVPNIYIYYSLPIYVLVSPEREQLRDRLAYGFDRMQETGEGEKLLGQCYKALKNDLISPEVKVFVADTTKPALPVTNLIIE